MPVYTTAIVDPKGRALFTADIYGFDRRLEEALRTRPGLRAFVPIWMDPLMTINGQTFMNDAIRLGGGEKIVFQERLRSIQDCMNPEPRWAREAFAASLPAFFVRPGGPITAVRPSSPPWVPARRQAVA